MDNYEDEKKSIAEQLEIAADPELSDKISDLFYEDKPMSDEGYNEMLARWQCSGSATNELPKIEKLSFSIRKGEGKDQMIYTGSDSKSASYDPFAVYGIDELDEETAIRNEMADYVLSYVRNILDKDGKDLGYVEMDLGYLEGADRSEAKSKQISKNDEIVSGLRVQAKSTEDFLCLKERLITVQKHAKADYWSKIDYEEGEHFAGLTFGTATEAHIVLLELRDPEAYVCKTRIFTGDNGFDKEEEKLKGDDLAILLSTENKAREAWKIEMNAEPAIGVNRNEKKPSKKTKSIKRKD